MTKAALADGNRSIELFCWGTNLERKLQLEDVLARISSFELRPFQWWGFMLVATAADEKITYEGCSAMIAGSLSKRPDRRRNESGHSRIQKVWRRSWILAKTKPFPC